jgi:hypothetical protein
MISKGLTALLFVVMVVIIVFLMFQIQDNASRCKESRIAGQDRVAKASRLLVQSATQNHPLFAHEHALEAKLIIDDLVNDNGGLTLAEKNLKLAKGKLEDLRQQIYEQHSRMLERFPEVDIMGTLQDKGESAAPPSSESREKSRKKKSSSSRH